MSHLAIWIEDHCKPAADPGRAEYGTRHVACSSQDAAYGLTPPLRIARGGFAGAKNT